MISAVRSTQGVVQSRFMSGPASTVLQDSCENPCDVTKNVRNRKTKEIDVGYLFFMVI